MADNLTTQSATPATVPSGSAIATDDVSGVHFQKVKIDVGGDGASVVLSSSNPLPVHEIDSYVEDAAAAANPSGPVLIMIRDDGLGGTLTSADGDNVAARGTDRGELYVKDVDNAIYTEKVSQAIVMDDAAFTPGSTRVIMVGAEFDDTSPDSVNEGDGGAVRMSANRNLYITLRDAAGNERGLNIDANGEIQISGSRNPLSVNSHHVTNAGTFATQVDGAALTALQLIDDPVLADDAAFTPGTTKVGMAGFEADETSTDSVDEGDAGAARMTLDRKLITTPQPHTNGGLSIFRSLDLDETEEEVKASAGQIYGWYIANLATSTRFIKIYNATAANVTVGTTTPVITIPLPGNSTDDVGANALGGMGISFDTAITVAATTGLADNDTGAPGANEVVVNIFYK